MLTEETLKAVVADIVDSLVRTELRTIIIVSMHRGNYVLWSELISELDRGHPDPKVLRSELQLTWNEACKAAGFTTPQMHAGESEASFIASLRPDLVGRDPVDFPDTRERPAGVRLDHTGFPLDVREVSPSGALGEPSEGNRLKRDSFWRVLLGLAVRDVKWQAGSAVSDCA
jgi:creatinine amidohydrolase/Fe(II)-dependent formamide hydrolase-like protein